MRTYSVLLDVERTVTYRVEVEAEDEADAQNQAIDDVLLRQRGILVDEATRDVGVVECEVQDPSTLS